jgi:hypothetical protein
LNSFRFVICGETTVGCLLIINNGTATPLSINFDLAVVKPDRGIKFGCRLKVAPTEETKN